MKKSLTAITVLSVSAIAGTSNADPMDDLLNYSVTIEDQITLGVQSVGGAMSYAPIGGVIEDGGLQGYIDQYTVDAYNDALVAVQNYNYSYGAAEFFLENADEQMDILNQAVDTFSNAVVEMTTVFAVADIAEDAVDSGEQEAQEAVQSFITDNNVSLEQSTVQVYNDSLETIETAAQSAALFTAAASNDSFMGEIDQAASSFGVSVVDIELEYSAELDLLQASFTSSMNTPETLIFSNVYTQALGEVYKTSVDVLNAGAQEEYYTSFLMFRESGPMGSVDPIGGPSTPPNTVMYRDPQGQYILGITDSVGNLIEVMPGDEVYHPMTGQYLGVVDVDYRLVS